MARDLQHSVKSADSSIKRPRIYMTNASIKLAHPSDRNANRRTHFQAAVLQEEKMRNEYEKKMIIKMIITKKLLFLSYFTLEQII